MSYRDQAGEDVGADVRGLADRVRDLERMKNLSGRVSVGSLRVGDFVISVEGVDLVARSLTNPANFSTILTGP